MHCSQFFFRNITIIFFLKAPIFGVAIVKGCDAAGFAKNGFFGVALGTFSFLFRAI
jgi:hypothetical protein